MMKKYIYFSFNTVLAIICWIRHFSFPKIPLSRLFDTRSFWRHFWPSRIICNPEIFRGKGIFPSKTLFTAKVIASYGECHECVWNISSSFISSKKVVKILPSKKMAVKSLLSGFRNEYKLSVYEHVCSICCFKPLTLSIDRNSEMIASRQNSSNHRQKQRGMIFVVRKFLYLQGFTGIGKHYYAHNRSVITVIINGMNIPKIVRNISTVNLSVIALSSFSDKGRWN